LTVWPTIQPLGDRAILLSYENRIDPAITRKLRRLAAAVEESGFGWLEDVSFSFRCLNVVFDPRQIALAQVQAAVQKIEAGLGPLPAEDDFDIFEIPTVYGGQDGPDLDQVADLTGRSPAQLVEEFSTIEFTIHFLGFIGAQPYLGGLPEALHLPRRKSPRPFIPAGSVGLGGIQAGVMTIDQPSGFNYLGRTYLTLYDPGRMPPSPLKPGDKLLFPAIARDRTADCLGRFPQPREKGGLKKR